MTTVAVIGCTHAGTFATTSILAEHPDWTVHVFERNGTLSFLSCGIALWVGDHVSDPKKMFYSSPAALAEAGATMHMRTDVTSVDLDARTLTYRALDEAGDPAEQTLAFDKLVVTTGSRPVIPPIPGIDSPHVLLCKNWDHAIAIKEKAKTAKSAVVIGSGYIGAEIAEQFSVTGVKTTLVDGLIARWPIISIRPSPIRWRPRSRSTASRSRSARRWSSSATMTTTPSLWSPKRASTRPKWRFWPSASCRTPTCSRARWTCCRTARSWSTTTCSVRAGRVRRRRLRHRVLQPHRPARLHSAGHQRGAPGPAGGPQHRDATVKYMARSHVRRAAVRSLARRLRPDPRRCRTPRAHGPRDLAHRGLSPGLHAHHHPSHVDSDLGPGNPQGQGRPVLFQGRYLRRGKRDFHGDSGRFTIDQLANVDFLFQPNFDKPVYYVAPWP